MKNKPLISIIVPLYKVEKFLPKCVESVLAQTYQNWELELVDNGSPDNCYKLCVNYADKDSRIKAFHVLENKGVSSGRNRGVEEATGDYITFFDADDYLHPEFLETMVRLCLDYDADLAQCAHIRGDDYIFPTEKKDTQIQFYDSHSVFISEVSNIVVWGKLYKSDIVKGIEFPNGKFYEDDRTTWKYYSRAKKIVVTSRPLYYYYMNSESTMVQLTKAPSLNYTEAYDERLNYYTDLGYQDMIDLTNLQLCKSLVLTYSDPLLSLDQKEFIKKQFAEAWRTLKQSKYIKNKYKVLFFMFSISPYGASVLAQKLR